VRVDERNNGLSDFAHGLQKLRLVWILGFDFRHEGVDGSLMGVGHERSYLRCLERENTSKAAGAPTVDGQINPVDVGGGRGGEEGQGEEEAEGAGQGTHKGGKAAGFPRPELRSTPANDAQPAGV
jgi:hypothetical protein